jgi:hypothetical protein
MTHEAMTGDEYATPGQLRRTFVPPKKKEKGKRKRKRGETGKRERERESIYSRGKPSTWV